MKKLWNNNRILFVLVSILIVCFIAIITVAFTFFYHRNVSVYGERLENIKKYPIKDDFTKSFKQKILKNENVTKVDLNVKGRIIYITITFDNEIELENAKEIAEASLKSFNEKYLGYYDIEFILKSSNFKIIGAKNAVVDHTSWNNNTQIVEEEPEDEEEK